MSSYTVEFKGTRAEREAQALEECKQYLGRSFNKTVANIAVVLDDKTTRKTHLYRSVRLGLDMFVGIRGYWPVRALIRAALKK